MKDIHRKVLQLRQQEKSLAHIALETGLAKSTVSWVLSKNFPKFKNRRIAEKLDRAAKRTGSWQQGAESRKEGLRQWVAQNKQRLLADYLAKFQGYRDQSLIWYISGLYDGEGAHVGTEFRLTNSDPQLITPFLRFLQEVLMLNRTDYSTTLTLHKSQVEVACVRYWKERLKIDIDHVYRYDSTAQKKVHKHKSTYFGVVTVRMKTPNGVKEALRSYRPSAM